MLYTISEQQICAFIDLKKFMKLFQNYKKMATYWTNNLNILRMTITVIKQSTDNIEDLIIRMEATDSNEVRKIFEILCQ